MFFVKFEDGNFIRVRFYEYFDNNSTIDFYCFFFNFKVKQLIKKHQVNEDKKSNQKNIQNNKLYKMTLFSYFTTILKKF